MLSTNEMAGSVAALSGLEDAEAASPTTYFTSGEDLSPKRQAPSVERVHLEAGWSQEPPEASIGAAGSIDGGELLDRVRQYLCRFVSYPSERACVSHLLWIAHTHFLDICFTSPRLAVLSAEPGSGKSRVLEMTALLVPRPLLSARASSAYIMRKIANQEERPTVLIDEIDTVFGPLAHGNEDLRGLLNTGYRRGFKVGRCYTDKGKVLTEELDPFGAVAMGGLGELPGTLMTRSVIIRMRKPAPEKRIESFRPRLHEQEGRKLGDELAAWANSVLDLARVAEPVLPPGVVDRHEDVWGPMLTVAALAGDPWYDLAADAALEAVHEAKVEAEPSLGIQLLADIKRCFGDEDCLPSEELVSRLLADEEAPWGDLKGRMLNQRKLAQLLKPYGIKSAVIRIGESTPRGYRREFFHDAWVRYLPSAPPTATSATGATPKD